MQSTEIEIDEPDEHEPNKVRLANEEKVWVVLCFRESKRRIAGIFELSPIAGESSRGHTKADVSLFITCSETPTTTTTLRRDGWTDPDQPSPGICAQILIHINA